MGGSCPKRVLLCSAPKATGRRDLVRNLRHEARASLTWGPVLPLGGSVYWAPGLCVPPDLGDRGLGRLGKQGFPGATPPLGEGGDLVKAGLPSPHPAAVPQFPNRPPRVAYGAASAQRGHGQGSPTAGKGRTSLSRGHRWTQVDPTADRCSPQWNARVTPPRYTHVPSQWSLSPHGNTATGWSPMSRPRPPALYPLIHGDGWRVLGALSCAPWGGGQNVG